MLSKSPMFVQMFSRRFRGVSFFVAGGTLLASFAVAGCGGGGGGVSNPTPVPVATSVSAACDSTTYRPNYYGLPEPGSSSGEDNIYTFWRQFPISVYIEPSSTAFRTATVAGFDQWVASTGGRASYRLVSSASGADMTVSFSPQNANSDTLGLTTVNYFVQSRAISSVEMELFYYTTSDRLDANSANQSIAAHELGHGFGIGAHSPFDADLMFPTLERAEEEVTTRDLNTLKTIYCDRFPTRSTAGAKDKGPIKSFTIRN